MSIFQINNSHAHAKAYCLSLSVLEGKAFFCGILHYLTLHYREVAQTKKRLEKNNNKTNQSAVLFIALTTRQTIERNPS